MSPPAGFGIRLSRGLPDLLAFTQQGALIVSEAFGGAALASAVSSYDLNGGLSLVSASVPTGQTAACWIAVSKNGKFAYSTNAGSNSVSAYRVETDGNISLIEGAAGTGSLARLSR